jgi:hypothetical protein
MCKRIGTRLGEGVALTANPHFVKVVSNPTCVSFVRLFCPEYGKASIAFAPCALARRIAERTSSSLMLAPRAWGNGMQVSFAAPTREAVDAAWRIALAHGGVDEGPPGPRPAYALDYYGAYCRDPEGNKLCFVHAGGLC